ncbi:MAG TPA: bifunctional 2-polyprenyl-6-hydroxyphenol methylase/3-demethylubiquinol 3-O-methyltransferase UbiG [Steroidobacteraceae bacterium]|nr:bifunctional 2-polyprenyl-6-hydroxyphenol methylase/3-demethylubiquinol 3-O-methyltransferase UbiG [Steroidobacteraceae bacterium]
MSGARTLAEPNADSDELRKFEELAHRFWDPAGEFRPLHLLNPVRAQFIADRASLAGARALDVGCGGGLLAETLARAGATVTGIDLAPGMIDAARAHAAAGELRIDYRVASAEALAAAEPHSFDLVACMELLEHVPDPKAMVASLADLLRPGGQLFVSTIHRNLKAFLAAILAAEYVLRLLPRGTHEYERLIRPSELARWGRAAELSLCEIAGLGVDPLSGRCTLTRDPSVNYLAHFVRRRASAGAVRG